MPFAGYSDFADCVARNREKDNPQAYCGAIQHEVEGKSNEGYALSDLPENARAIWATSFVEALKKNEPSGASKVAWASVMRQFERGPNGQWNQMKVFADVQFKSIFKSDRIVYGAASVAIVDSDNELITEEALKTAFRSYVDRGHVLFYHKNIPVGEVLPFYDAPDGTKYQSGVTEGKLNVVVRFYKDTQISNDVWNGIERGELRAFSIGGQTIGDAVKVCESADCSKWHNRIDRIDLHEISIVPNPANDASYFTIIKSKVESMEKKEVQKNEKDCDCAHLNDEELIGKIAAATAKLLKEQHQGECPDGQHMVDGECVPMTEKKTETTMTEEKKTEAPVATPDPVKADVDALKVEVKGFAERFDKLETLLTKALEPKPVSVVKPESEPPKPPTVSAEKKSVAISEMKGEPTEPIDWTTIGIEKPGVKLDINSVGLRTAFAKLKKVA